MALAIRAAQAIPVVIRAAPAIPVVIRAVQVTQVVIRAAQAIPVVIRAAQAIPVVTREQQIATVMVLPMSSTNIPMIRPTSRTVMGTVFMISLMRTQLTLQTPRLFGSPSIM